jgi:hypothetical protein
VWIDRAIAIYSAIGALLLFLLQWAGKRLLDSLVWPVLADWAARFNRTWATSRAEGILQLYILEWKRSSDIRYLLIHVEQRISIIVLFPLLLI